MARSSTRSTARERELARLADRQRRRQAMYTARVAGAPTAVDRLLVAVDYLRGALGDVPPTVADREVDRLLGVLVETTGRLHQTVLPSHRTSR